MQIIDLHGLSWKAAIKVLDDSIPKLMDDAMTEFPWVVPVCVVCGCESSQVLSEAVEQWMKSCTSCK